MSQLYKALFRECYFLIDLLITMYYVTVCYNNCVSSCIVSFVVTQVRLSFVN